MRYSKIISKVIATIMIASVILPYLGSITYAAEVWGFNSGTNPHSSKTIWIKENYVGDYAIWESLGTYTTTQGQDILRSYCFGKYSADGIALGYCSFRQGNQGSDRQLYSLLCNVKGVNDCTFKDVFKKGGKYYESNPNFGKDTCNEQLTPDNSDLYSPLNMLRLMQIYLVSRSGDSKTFIGGWPVHISNNANTTGTYVYEIEGARTIKTVYKVFTGKSYSESSALDKAEKGVNCTEDSICFKLLKGKITMSEGVKEFKKALKSENITLYTGNDLFTAGNMTYEEYFARCLRNEYGTTYDVDQNNITWSESLVNYFNTVPDVSMSALEKEFFYTAVFRYLQEYGIRFYSAEEGNQSEDDDICSIFTGDGSEDFPLFENGSIKNLVSGSDDVDGISSAIKSRMKKYINSNSESYALGSSNTKPRMNEIATSILEAIKDGTGASTDEEANEILSKYIIMTEDSELGKAMESIEVSAENSQTSKDVNDKNEKLLSGFNNLNKISDSYVAKFFLNLATTSGTTDNSVVNNEYNKIINILSRDHVRGNEATMEECYSMLYSMEVIRDQDANLCKTFKAKDSSQIQAVLTYCKTHLKRTYNYFTKSKTDSNLEEITFGKSTEQNPSQMYSDWCEAVTTIKAMGGKAYGRANPNSSSADNYDNFNNKYTKWKSNLKTGKTKYVKGVQHQDGFVPYGLKSDTEELKEGTENFFKDKNNSLEGKFNIKDTDTKDKKQKKILKWTINTNEVNETIRKNYWLTLTNNVLTIVGTLLFTIGVCISAFYMLDHVSGNNYEITKKVTFNRLSYTFNKKERRKILFKFFVFVGIAAMMYDGTLIRAATYLVLFAYNMFSPK